MVAFGIHFRRPEDPETVLAECRRLHYPCAAVPPRGSADKGVRESPDAAIPHTEVIGDAGHLCDLSIGEAEDEEPIFRIGNPAEKPSSSVRRIEYPPAECRPNPEAGGIHLV